MSVDFEVLRNAARQHRIQWQQHALERVLERGISRQEIVDAIVTGEVIEVYPEDRPYPSCLMLRTGTEPLHVVASLDSDAGICHVITTYRPDLKHFEADFKTRRKPT